jgi:AraC-like DNA-binding protein
MRQATKRPDPGTAIGETATYWRARDLGDLELLRAHYITFSYAPHAHEGYAIGVIEEGAERFEYRHSSYVVPAGAIALINPGEPHTGAAATPDGWRYRMLYPEVGLLQRAASELSGRRRDVPFFAEPVMSDPALAKKLLGLHAMIETSTDPLERESQMLGVFAMLVERHADTLHLAATIKAEPISVRRVRTYLEEHASEPITLAELAALSSTSAYHLLRTFHAATGLPPHAYLTQIRIGRAKHLLAQGYTPTEVATLVGFYDQSHLTRHFKRTVGVPPAQYAREVC